MKDPDGLQACLDFLLVHSMVTMKIKCDLKTTAELAPNKNGGLEQPALRILAAVHRRGKSPEIQPAECAKTLVNC